MLKSLSGQSAIVVKNKSRNSLPPAEFESHKRYIDLQYLVSGEEMIGFSNITKLNISKSYEHEKDLILYDIPLIYKRLNLLPGDFAIFFPEDGHMPNCHMKKSNELHKIVVKISV